MHRVLPLFLILLLAAAAPAGADTYDVDRTDDDASAGAQVCSGAANDCSLRGAIIKANGHAGADTITLGAHTYTVTLSNPAGTHEDAAATGDLDITGDLTSTTMVSAWHRSTPRVRPPVFPASRTA